LLFKVHIFSFVIADFPKKWYNTSATISFCFENGGGYFGGSSVVGLPPFLLKTAIAIFTK
jgi:hypothetical protein